MVWLNQQDKTVSQVKSIRTNKSGSGYLIACEDFDCFAWTSDKLIEQLFLAISQWIESGKGYKLEVYADTTAKRGFNVRFIEQKGKRIEIPWYVMDNGFSTEKTEDIIVNPFL